MTLPLVPQPATISVGTGTIDVRTLRLETTSTVRDWAKLAAELLKPLGVALVDSPDALPLRLAGSEYTEAWDGAADAIIEGYTLAVGPDGVDIRGTTPVGALHGLRTFAHLCTTGPDAVPYVNVFDGPQYAWRALHLDLARHWHGPKTIRRIIDLAGLYKLRQLHLHLSDDQGWRIEVPSFPALTRVSGRTQMGGFVPRRERGYLTLDEYQELQEYAAERFITIVPEIDLPGHTNAALHALPELNPDGTATEAYGGLEVGFSRLWIDNPATEPFLRTMLTEIAEATLGPWFHVGGDEVHTMEPEEYQAIVAIACSAVREAGKIPVAWQEAAPVASDGMLLQFWDPRAATEPIVTAVERGAGVIMAPATKAYLDMKVEASDPMGLQWAAFIDLATARNWEPTAMIPGLNPAAIAGVEACLWTETLATLDDLTSMLLPRLAATAEVAWSLNNATTPVVDIEARLRPHTALWDAHGFAYRDPARWFFEQ